MVERLFIHNYKGFVNFEMKFGRTVLLVGRNGSGKSSLIDVLHSLVMVAADGSIEDSFAAGYRFRFANFPTQQFELDVRLAERLYRYRIEIGFSGSDELPYIIREELHVGGEQLFLFQAGALQLASKSGAEPPPPISVSPLKGGLWIVLDGLEAGEFKEWIHGFLKLKLDPSSVDPQAKRATASMFTDGSDFAAWYENVSNADTAMWIEYRRTMQAVIPGLDTINLKTLGRGKLWEAVFLANGGKGAFVLDELSDGQICLIILYAVLYFWIRRGSTVALDEPDNYVALAEIEPLIHALDDAADEEKGQVFLISHHPEVYNRWARDPERCRYLTRTEEGLFVARPIDWNEYPGLMPSEVVARGWEDA